MKSKKFVATLLILCVVLAGSLHAQKSSSPDPGTTGYIQRTVQYPSPQNGNGALGVFFDSTACGLQYTTAAVKTGQRFVPAGVSQPAAMILSGIPANASIIKAFLCVNGSGNGAAQTANLSGPIGTQSFPLTITGTDVDYCWLFAGAYTYRADVTSIIAGNGTYYLSGLLTCPPNLTTNDMSGALLFVIYNVPSANFEGRLILADGAKSILGGTATSYIYYPPICSAPSLSKAFCLVSDFQYAGSTVTMDAATTTFTGSRWDFVELSTSATSGQSSSAFTATKNGDCFCQCLAGLYLQSSACITCPSSPALNATVTTSAATCSACNGSATVTSVSGGMPPYTYAWGTSPVQTTQTATGLCPGNYSVVVTSSGGFYSDTQLVIVPAVGNAITATASQQNVLCNNDSTATVLFAGNGGTGPYTFTWSPNVVHANSNDTTSAQSLAAGMYVVSITDTFGCSATHTFNITEPPALLAMANTLDASCFGMTDGAISLTTTGGTVPYQWNWSNGDTSSSLASLATGYYSVVVYDSAGCMFTDTFFINEPAAVTFISPFDTLCSSNGSITLTGASPPGGFFSGTGVNGNNFDPSQANTGYNVIVYTDTLSQCTAMDSIFVDLCMSSGDHSPALFSIYPNPVNDVLYMHAANGGFVTLYDALGQIVSTRVIAGNSTEEINTGQLAAGIYIAQMETGNSTFWQKVIISH